MDNTISIAIVDDSPLIAYTLRSTLIKKGYNVLVNASNGKEFIDELSSTGILPDICIMDVEMPVMDGITTTAYIKTHYPEIKVVAHSGNDDSESVIKMLNNGASSYLLKGCSADQLDYAIKETLTNGFYLDNWALAIVLDYIRVRKFRSVA